MNRTITGLLIIAVLAGILGFVIYSNEALREYIRLKKRKDLTELAGLIQFRKGYDHKKSRKTRG